MMLVIKRRDYTGITQDDRANQEVGHATGYTTDIGVARPI